MKNFGCIVPVSLVFLLALLLSSCASPPFGTFTDKSSVKSYLDRHHPRHRPVVKAQPAADVADPYACFGAGRYDAMSKGLTCANRDVAVDSKGEPAPLDVTEKPKKKRGWLYRMFHHKKKDQ